jgi:C-terminal processing protease CtpA/Prc
MRMRRAVAGITRAAGLTAALALAGVPGSLAAPLPARDQPAQGALYRCADRTTLEVASLGLALCDAQATPLLARRAEPDNLQTREGALVVEVEPEGIAAVAGVQAGDMIYRVAGADVAGADDAGTGLASVGTDSDTLVNFLRRGRPYLVKLRR